MVQNGFTEYFGGFVAERVTKVVRNETRTLFHFRTLQRLNRNVKPMRQDRARS